MTVVPRCGFASVHEIVLMAAEGMTNKAIAAELGTDANPYSSRNPRIWFDTAVR